MLTFPHSYFYFFIPLCIAGGVFVAWLVYRRKAEGFSKPMHRTLFVLRALATTILLFLLLQPLLKTTERKIEKPRVAWLLDNSQSVWLAQDDSLYAEKLQSQISAWRDDFGNDVTHDFFLFDGTFRPDSVINLAGEATDISNALSELKNWYRGQPVAAAVLVSDGIYNRGGNPVLQAERLNIPIIAVGMGDTTVYPDWWVETATHNPSVFLGNQFQIEVVVRARDLSGSSVPLSARFGDSEFATEKMVAANADFTYRRNFTVKADKPGLQKIEVVLGASEEEENTKNNRWVSYINVVENRKKILLAYAAPHPDVNALRSAIAQLDEYTVEVAPQSANPEYASFDVVVFHGLTDRLPPTESLRKSRAGLWFFVMDDAQQRKLSNMKFIAPPTIRGQEYSQGDYNPAFGFFNLSQEQQAFFQNLPPLQGPAAPPTLRGSAQTLFSQRIGRVNTEMPLISYAISDENRTALTSGGGIWQWRMQNFRSEKNHQAFDQWVQASVKFLGQSQKRERLEVDVPQKLTSASGATWRARVYNKTFEPEPRATVNLTLVADETGDDFQFSFLGGSSEFSTITRGLPRGNYAWRVTAELPDGDKLSKSGKITVREELLEAQNLRADFDLLRQISEASGGHFVALGGDVAAAVKQSASLKPTERYRESWTEIIHSPWWFFIPFLLLAVEWTLRRFYGEI